MSEVELLKKQLAVLQEKMDREEEDRYIASLAVVDGREKKRRNKAKRETKTDNRKDREKSSKLSDDASDTSEFCKLVSITRSSYESITNITSYTMI